MTALAALVFTDGRPATAGLLERMGAALAPLGGPASVFTDGPAGLLFRPDPLAPRGGERQPLAGAGSRLVVVLDGRLDARDELAAALGLDPATAREASDARLALAAWEAWGEEAPCRLAGSFALVVWDARERTLFAAASPSGARMLHHHQGPGHLALATMPRGLFALPGVERRVDPVALAGFLLDLTSHTRSFAAGVSVLPPGHQLRFRDGSLSVRSFWSPLPAREVRLASDGEYVEAFRGLLGRVVSDHLRGAEPVAISLSGGLDSSAVAATAALALAPGGGRLLAFTEVPREGFDGPVPAGRYADETPLVTAIARHHPNLDLVLVRTPAGSFLDGLDESQAHREAPFRNAFNRPWLEAVNREARARGARVVLTGLGGNLTASWDGRSLLATLVRRGLWSRALDEARALAREGGAPSAGRALVAHGLLPALPRPVRRAARRTLDAWARREDRGWSAWSLARPAFVAELRMEERARELTGSPIDRTVMEPAEARAWMLALGSGGSFEAGALSLHGVDLRHPLYDARLVDFCLGVPDGQFLRDGRTRWLVRRAMEGRLPPEVLDNGRRGLQAADWFESLRHALPRLRERVAAFQGSALLRHALDLPRLGRLLDELPSVRWDDPRVAAEYAGALGRAVTSGSFVLWAERKARQEGAG